MGEEGKGGSPFLIFFFVLSVTKRGEGKERKKGKRVKKGDRGAPLPPLVRAKGKKGKGRKEGTAFVLFNHLQPRGGKGGAGKKKKEKEKVGERRSEGNRPWPSLNLS